MPKPKSPKKAKRVTKKVSLTLPPLVLKLEYDEVLREKAELQLSHDEWLKRAEAAERHNAELLREVEELRKKVKSISVCDICGALHEQEITTWVCDEAECLRKYADKLQPPTRFQRLRAFLRSFSRKGLSAGE